MYICRLYIYIYIIIILYFIINYYLFIIHYIYIYTYMHTCTASTHVHTYTYISTHLPRGHRLVLCYIITKSIRGCPSLVQKQREPKASCKAKGKPAQMRAKEPARLPMPTPADDDKSTKAPESEDKVPQLSRAKHHLEKPRATSQPPLTRQMSHQNLSGDLTQTTAATPSPHSSQTQEVPPSQPSQDVPCSDTCPDTQVVDSPQLLRSSKRLKTVGDVAGPDGALQSLDRSCLFGFSCHVS